MIRKVAFTMYPALDVMRAKTFYEDLLGFSANKVHAQGDGHWVEFDLPEGGCFAITDLATQCNPSDSRGGTIAFEVDDIEQLVNQLKSNGTTFKVEPFETPVCRIAVGVDSEGNAFTLHQLKNKRTT